MFQGVRRSGKNLKNFSGETSHAKWVEAVLMQFSACRREEFQPLLKNLLTRELPESPSRRRHFSREKSFGISVKTAGGGEKSGPKAAHHRSEFHVIGLQTPTAVGWADPHLENHLKGGRLNWGVIPRAKKNSDRKQWLWDIDIEKKYERLCGRLWALGVKQKSALKKFSGKPAAGRVGETGGRGRSGIEILNQKFCSGGMEKTRTLQPSPPYSVRDSRNDIREFEIRVFSLCVYEVSCRKIRRPF